MYSRDQRSKGLGEARVHRVGAHRVYSRPLPHRRLQGPHSRYHETLTFRMDLEVWRDPGKDFQPAVTCQPPLGLHAVAAPARTYALLNRNLPIRN